MGQSTGQCHLAQPMYHYTKDMAQKTQNNCDNIKLLGTETNRRMNLKTTSSKNLASARFQYTFSSAVRGTTNNDFSLKITNCLTSCILYSVNE